MSRNKPPRIALDLSGMIGIGKSDIFRLSGGTKRDPAVEVWLAGDPAELRSIARKWFEIIRNCGADVSELMHDGCPVACVEDAVFAYVNSFKNHVNVGFFNGAMLDDPTRLMEGGGKRMRHVKVYPGRPMDNAALSDLIDAAYLDVQARLGKCKRTQ